MIIRLAATSYSSVVIENSFFASNFAEVDGGGVYISLSQYASSNQLVMVNNTFLNNSVQNASGGAVSINSFLISYNNTVMVNSSLFMNNSGNAGEREGGEREGGEREGEERVRRVGKKGWVEHLLSTIHIGRWGSG